jgi:hypothetical protein
MPVAPASICNQKAGGESRDFDKIVRCGDKSNSVGSNDLIRGCDGRHASMFEISRFVERCFMKLRKFRLLPDPHLCAKGSSLGLMIGKRDAKPCRC